MQYRKDAAKLEMQKRFTRMFSLVGMFTLLGLDGSSYKQRLGRLKLSEPSKLHTAFHVGMIQPMAPKGPTTSMQLERHVIQGNPSC